MIDQFKYWAYQHNCNRRGFVLRINICGESRLLSGRHLRQARNRYRTFKKQQHYWQQRQHFENKLGIFIEKIRKNKKI